MSDVKPETKKAKTPEPTKSDRLDRLEDKIQLIEKGILILINAVWWQNATITPIGTHDPDVKMQEFETLMEAVIEDGKDKE